MYQDIETLDGFAEHPIIGSLVRAEWFRNAHAPGIKCQGKFCPIRPVTVVLVMTAVRVSLSASVDLESNGTL